MIKRSQSVAPPPTLADDPAADLFAAVAMLTSPQEASDFLRDLCTIQELQALSTRWQVARLLNRGMHYQEIAERTGASTATISRVSSWLRFGTGGYRTMLERWPQTNS
ncbi:MAG: YerC/YecD family TrpR-related protein [Candidatus Dormibacteria bacterium]